MNSRTLVTGCVQVEDVRLLQVPEQDVGSYTYGVW